ncbi:hypothetical protein DFAR_270009 [Desulfarculales bacterium]
MEDRHGRGPEKTDSHLPFRRYQRFFCQGLHRDYMECGERERLLQDKRAQRWQNLFSNRTRLSRTTILVWVRLYRQDGGKLESLYPMGRKDRCGSRALGEDTAQGLGPSAQGTAHCVSDYPH